MRTFLTFGYTFIVIAALVDVFLYATARQEPSLTAIVLDNILIVILALTIIPYIRKDEIWNEGGKR